MQVNSVGQQISKQKWAIIVVVILISSIWGGVLYLEYKISQQKVMKSTIQLEDGLCLQLPNGCHALFSVDHYALYCKSGTAGKILLNSQDQLKSVKDKETIVTEIKGAAQSYFLELKINENMDRQLGTVVACPKN